MWTGCGGEEGQAGLTAEAGGPQAGLRRSLNSFHYNNEIVQNEVFDGYSIYPPLYNRAISSLDQKSFSLIPTGRGSEEGQAGLAAEAGGAAEPHLAHKKQPPPLGAP